MNLRRVTYGRALGRVERDMNRIIDVLNGTRLKSAPGYRLKETSNGTSLDIEVPAAEASTPASAKQFQLVAVFGDYVTAREWDGTNQGALTKIAKPHHLRRSPFDLQSETVLVEDPVSGNTTYTIAYEYRSHTFRIATITKQGVTLSVVEKQVPTPFYKTGASLIYAIEPENGTAAVDESGEDITWIDLNADARAWARKP